MLLGWAGFAAYSRYKKSEDARAERDFSIARLKQDSHPQWHFRKTWCRICTSDKEPKPTPASDFDFTLMGEGSQRFTSSPPKASGHMVGVWISDWSPRAEITKFETLRVDPSGRGPHFEVIAKPHPGQSILMEFEVTCILENTH